MGNLPPPSPCLLLFSSKIGATGRNQWQHQQSASGQGTGQLLGGKIKAGKCNGSESELQKEGKRKGWEAKGRRKSLVAARSWLTKPVLPRATHRHALSPSHSPRKLLFGDPFFSFNVSFHCKSHNNSAFLKPIFLPR